MRILTATILLIIPTISHAANLCNPGYYLDTTTDECAKCGNGRYYCPGDNMRYDCPAPSTHLNSDWPDEYYDTIIYSVSHYSDGNHIYAEQKSAQQCPVMYWLTNTYGKLYDIRQYNEATGLYDTPTSSWGWTDANPGYYLTNPKACFSYAYYYNATTCRPGAYCPGISRHRCENYTQPDDFGIYVCGDNSYSDSGASECTPCPHGTGNNGDDISAHAGVTSCLPLCAAGYTKLHAGNYVFNIWSGHQCTSPSLHIGNQNNVCCINLAPGTGNGINIQIGNDIYHTTN